MLTARTIKKVPEVTRSTASRAAAPSPSAPPDDVRSTPAIRAALLRIAGEYREMPGLRLTLPQAARLLGVDRSTCELVMTTLIERKVLKRAPNGSFIRR
jgi:hypothetical protein